MFYSILKSWFTQIKNAQTFLKYPSIRLVNIRKKSRNKCSSITITEAAH